MTVSTVARFQIEQILRDVPKKGSDMKDELESGCCLFFAGKRNRCDHQREIKSSIVFVAMGRSIETDRAFASLPSIPSRACILSCRREPDDG